MVAAEAFCALSVVLLQHIYIFNSEINNSTVLMHRVCCLEGDTICFVSVADSA